MDGAIHIGIMMYNGKPVEFWRKKFLVGIWLLLPWAFFFSKAVISILMGCLAFLVVTEVKEIMKRRFINCMLPYFMISFIVLISGLWSYNTEDWFNGWKASFPLIIIPAGYYIHPGWVDRSKRLILKQFLWGGLALTGYMVFVYLNNGGDIIHQIQQGGSFPLPMNHIRTSLLLALSTLVGLTFYLKCRKESRGSFFYLLVAVVLFSGVHLLAVRTGMVLLYIGIFVLLAWGSNEWKIPWGWMTFGIVGLVLLLFLFLPSFRAKWSYWIDDLKNMNSYSWSFYSDAMRLKSIVLGWKVGISHPLFGVGIGDLRDEMAWIFLREENIRASLYPHNMFITWFAGYGLIGLGGMIYALVQLFFKGRMYQSPLFATIFILYMVSCLVENTLLGFLGCT